jgi:TusA-related sulfurtransferase
MTHVLLDARRLLCPLPVIRVQDQAGRLRAGDTIEIVCTDPGALQDIPAWCRIHAHRVLETRAQGREVLIRIEIGGSPS